MESFESLANKAYKEIELSEFPSLPERLAYIQLQNLYYRYRCKDFSKEEAITKKNKIRKEYTQNLKEYDETLRMYREYTENRIQNETLLHQLEKETDKDKIIQIALQIIANCVSDEMLVERYNQRNIN